MGHLIEIIEKVKQGDLEAFGKLVELVQNRLYKFCFFLTGKKEVAEDITQDVLIKAHAKIHLLKDPNTFMSWLFQIARNHFLDQVKGKKTITTLFTKEPVEIADMELIMSIRKALSHFEKEDQVLLILVDLEEFSYVEAGTILGISEDAVRSRIHRLREQFKKNYSSSETN